MDGEIVVTATALSRFNYLPLSFFHVDYLAYTPENFAAGTTVAGAMQLNTANGINSQTKINATANTPELMIITPSSYDNATKAQFFEDMGTIFSRASNSPLQASALAEMAASGVKWNVQVVQNFSDAIDPSTGLNLGLPNSNALEAITLGITAGAAASGGHYAPNTVLNTVILAPYAIGDSFDKVAIHELTHTARGPDGAMLIPESSVVPLVDPAFNAIFHPTNTSSYDGSLSSSLVLNVGDGNNLVFGTSGNNIITTGNGNNTVTVYATNSYVQTGAGSDYVQVLGGGAKYLKDAGGFNQNTLYISWYNGTGGFSTDYSDNKAGQIIGAVTIAPYVAGLDALSNPTRITVENFAASGYTGLSYTDTGGTIRTISFASLFPSAGPQSGTIVDDSAGGSLAADGETKIAGVVPPSLSFIPNRLPDAVTKVIGSPLVGSLPVSPKIVGGGSTALSASVSLSQGAKKALPSSGSPIANLAVAFPDVGSSIASSPLASPSLITPVPSSSGSSSLSTSNSKPAGTDDSATVPYIAPNIANTAVHSTAAAFGSAEASTAKFDSAALLLNELVSGAPASGLIQPNGSIDARAAQHGTSAMSGALLQRMLSAMAAFQAGDSLGTASPLQTGSPLQPPLVQLAASFG